VAGVVAILGATLLLGGPLSRVLGPLGAVLGFSAAFALGHAIMLVGFHRREAVPVRAIFPDGTLLLSLASAIAAALATLLYFRLGLEVGAATRAVAVVAACAAVLGPAVWLHPFRRELQGWVMPPGGER
jgi:hypothetical protein